MLIYSNGSWFSEITFCTLHASNEKSILNSLADNQKILYENLCVCTIAIFYFSHKTYKCQNWLGKYRLIKQTNAKEMIVCFLYPEVDIYTKDCKFPITWA